MDFRLQVFAQAGPRKEVSSPNPWDNESGAPDHSESDERTTVLDRPPQKERIKPPRKYAVVLLNDDFTPMEFVVFLLKELFQKSEDEAGRIMIKIHTQGEAVADVFSREIAECRVIQVGEAAKAADHPLKAEMRPVEQ